MKERTERLVILLTPSERKKLDAAARKRKVSRASILRESITRLKGARS